MMTTKEQERKALEQIKKILGGLEEDSYVKTAMKGMVEDAEDNIENDWAMSRYDAWESAEKKLEKTKAELREANEKIAELEAGNRAYENRIVGLLNDMDELKEKAEELKEARQRQMESDAVKANMKDYIETLERELGEARIKADAEVKEVEIRTAENVWFGRFAEVRYIDNNGFRFVNVVEESGWTTSYKLDDITGLVIK